MSNMDKSEEIKRVLYDSKFDYFLTKPVTAEKILKIAQQCGIHQKWTNETEDTNKILRVWPLI